jgi:pyruvate,water dikinase
MYNLGIPVPNGFVVTAAAYYKFVAENKLQDKLKKILDPVDIDQPDQLMQASREIKKIVKTARMGDDLAIDIMKAYKKLGGFGGLKNASVAVRSSATAEDLPDASFAGQQETFLNVIGESNVVRRVQDCWASLFTPRAIYYREKKHFDHFKIGIAVPVQKMINSEVSGIMFTVNPVNGDKTKVIVETIWGLGEYIVQGMVTPDTHIVSKHDWKVESKTHVDQDVQLVKSNNETHEVVVPKSKQKKEKINDEMAIKIAKIGMKLQNHYAKGQDCEIAIENGKVYIVQTRPITTIESSKEVIKNQKLISKEADLLGESASPGTAVGTVVIIKSPKEIGRAKKGQILVTEMTTPDFVPAMRRVNGIITDKGGQTSHAAIVSRELGVPCVVGTKTATKFFKDGELVTIDGTNGKIWRGDVSGEIKTEEKVFDIKNIKTATKVYCNLGEPDLASIVSKRNVDGIGLLRAEFMIANIGVHPKKLIADRKQKQYIDQLVEGMLKFCKSFNPRPVIYRATDFKTNEYRHLKWGYLYEPEESNPMLGFRGASRYISSPDVFLMELEAMKIVRNKYNLKNLWLMIPFVRTPEELMKVKQIVATAGLLRSPTFKLFMMVEIPSNVIQLNKFIDVGIDGISIGSNDLTMLTLGLDRDNQEVAKDFNEMDPAVLWSLRRVIKTAKKRGIAASICGQAPSNYPELVEKLVKWGATSVSVSPDAIERTREIVHWAEGKKISKKKR